MSKENIARVVIYAMLAVNTLSAVIFDSFNHFYFIELAATAIVAIFHISEVIHRGRK